jgi:hypothetical protein
MDATYELFSEPSNTGFTSTQQTTIREAIGILESRLRTTETFTNPSAVKPSAVILNRPFK